MAGETMTRNAGVRDAAHEAGELLRRARRRRSLSQRALATAAGVSHTVVARIEAGTSQPTLPTLTRLLAAAGFEPTIGLVNTVRPSELLSRHKDDISALAGRHHVRTVEVFGSVATGRDGPNSDLDLLVEFEANAGGFERIDFAEAVQDLLGVEVDMVNPASASPEFLDAIRDERRSLASF